MVLRHLNLWFLSGRKIIIFLVVLVIFAATLEIWVVNRLATYGGQINQLEKSKSALMLQNQILKNQIAQNSSLKVLETKAHNLGFEPIKNIQYIKDMGLALSH